jgi:hypothetical protein
VADEDGQRTADLLKHPLSDDGQRHTWDQYYGQFAFAAVQVGDAWQRTFRSKLGTQNATYRLKRVRCEGGRTVAVVGYRVELGEASTHTERGTTFTPRDGWYAGTAYIDLDTMRLVNARESGTLCGEVASTDAEADAAGPRINCRNQSQKTEVLTVSERAMQRLRASQDR